jgi:alpha-beta hydrolase superfamily lysophospholipase
MNTSSVKTFDGTDIFTTKDTVQNPRAVMVIVHGLAEHAGRYDYVTRKLNENEISVYRFDLRGHGRSGGLRGSNDDPDNFLKDTDLVVRMALKENQGKPIFMLGHSMGGLIAAGYGAGHADVLKGMILSGAALDFLPAFGDLGKTYTEAMGNEVSPNSLAAAICRDPEVVKAYEEDPLVLKGVTLRLLYTTFIQGIERLHQNILSYRIPCLILHGGNDLLIPHSSPQWFYDHILSQDKTLKIYPECYHEILNEKEEKDLVIADMVGWMNLRR